MTALFSFWSATETLTCAPLESRTRPLTSDTSDRSGSTRSRLTVTRVNRAIGLMHLATVVHAGRGGHQTPTVGNSQSWVAPSRIRHESVGERCGGCRIRRGESGHHLHRMRASGDAPRPHRWTSLNSAETGMDRRLVGTACSACQGRVFVRRSIDALTRIVAEERAL
jgi:hypothetical protein